MALWTTQFALSAGDERLHMLEDRNQHLRQKLAALRLELASAKSIKDKQEKDMRAAHSKQKEIYEQMKQKGWSAEAELSGQLAVLEAKKASLITTKDIVDQEYYDLDDIMKTNKGSLDAQLMSLQSNLNGMATEKAGMRSLLRDAKHRLKHRLKECETLLDTQKDIDNSIAEALSLARAFVVRKLATVVQDDDILTELKRHYEKEVTAFSSSPSSGSPRRRTINVCGSELAESNQRASSNSLAGSTTRPKRNSKSKSTVSFITNNTSPSSRIMLEDLAYESSASHAPIAAASASALADDKTKIERQMPGDTGLLSTSALIKRALEQDSGDYYRRLLSEDAIREFGLSIKDAKPSPRSSSYLEKLLLPPVQDDQELAAAVDKPPASGLRAASSSKKTKRSSSLKRRAQQIKKYNKQYIDQLALIDILTEQRRTLQDKLVNITNIRSGTYTKASTIMMLRKQIGELTAEIEEMTRALPYPAVPKAN